MEFSEQINELASALAKAQAEMGNAKKSSANPFFNSKYADLAEVLDTCREPLSKNGLSVVQAVGDMEIIAIDDIEKNYNKTTKQYDVKQVKKSIAIINVTSQLNHSSGQWMKTTMRIPTTKVDAQAFGSAITYARRYSLAALIGIAQADDDAESTMIRNKPDTVQEAEQVFSAPAEPIYVKKDENGFTLVLMDNGKFYALEAFEKQGKLEALNKLSNDSRYAPCHDEIRTMMARMSEKK